MRYAFFIFSMMMLSSVTLGNIKQQTDHDIKNAPEHVGVAPELAPYVKSYMELAAKHNIKFTHTVTVGMAEIKDEDKKNGRRTIGLCTFGDGWREIDIDKEFFKNNSPERRKILIYHELTHCYCGRDHDYGAGEPYMAPEIERILASFNHTPFYMRKPGYYLDECPLSIMHPVIIEQACIDDHSDDYLEEMWNRCKPY